MYPISYLSKSIKFYGHISILVNCAAFGSKKVSEFSKVSKSLWNKTQKINILAPLILIQEFSKQKKAESVVNISSIESFIPAKNHEYYSISKSAVEGVPSRRSPGRSLVDRARRQIRPMNLEHPSIPRSSQSTSSCGGLTCR